MRTRIWGSGTAHRFIQKKNTFLNPRGAGRKFLVQLAEYDYIMNIPCRCLMHPHLHPLLFIIQAVQYVRAKSIKNTRGKKCIARTRPKNAINALLRRGGRVHRR